MPDRIRIMITDKDVSKLKEEFASMEELNELEKESHEFQALVVKHMATKEDLKKFATRDELFNKLDGMIKLILDN